MARRGRPRYPDILTPREWEVLALLREGLSNEQIATRLGITERTAKYHVSEILGKLGVSSRQEAARWQPSERPWWTAALVPFALWRKLGLSWLSPAVASVLGVGAVAGLGFLAWALVRTDGGSGLQAAVVSEPGVYIVRPDGSDLRQLPSSGRRLDGFAWAPSGHRFALVPGCDMEHDVLVGTAESPDLQLVATLPDSAYLNWSPQEDTIATSLRQPVDLSGGVLLIDLGTAKATPVGEATAFLGWSYDGRRYAVRSGGETIIVDTASGLEAELGQGIRSLLWSPTDDRLAFSYVVGSKEPPYDAWLESGVDIVNGDGTGRRVLVPPERYGMTSSASVVAWSPDGSRLLVETAKAPGFRFLVYDVDAPEQPHDFGETYKLSSGAWSPDGRHVAVERPQPDGSILITVFPASGGTGIEVSTGAAAQHPQFSPDSQQVAFVARRPGDWDAQDIYLANTDDGVPIMLSEVGMAIFDVAWSADGAYIAFTTGPVTSDGC